jgi:ribosomal-protein-alanine N-acetyltransferase
MSAQPQALWQLVPMSADQLPRIMQIERRAYPFAWTEGIFSDCLKVGYSSWTVQNPIGDILAYSVMSMAVGEAHILNLCVDPVHHGQGLGRFLLQHLLHVARSANLTVLLLEVRRSNAAARRLYQSAGFRTFGVRKDYYPAPEGREDALVLGFDIV